MNLEDIILSETSQANTIPFHLREIHLQWPDSEGHKVERWLPGAAGETAQDLLSDKYHMISRVDSKQKLGL